MSTKTKLNRKDFYDKIIYPVISNKEIVKYMDVDVYWAGKDHSLSSNLWGTCRTLKNKRNSIILRYRNNKSILNTFVHELGHALLHSGDRKKKVSMKEIEAETFALLTLKKLNQADEKHSERYISRYKEEYKKEYKKDYLISEEINQKIEDVSGIIATILTPIIKDLDDLDDTEKEIKRYHKYEITCDGCYEIFKFKKMTKFIQAVFKNGGREYGCPHCDSNSFFAVEVDEYGHEVVYNRF